MFYDKLDRMPEPGSLKEVVCIIVQRHRQEQEVYRLIAQMEAEPEAKSKALNNFKNSLAPYVSKQRDQESKAIADRMNKYIHTGQWVIKLDNNKNE